MPESKNSSELRKLPGYKRRATETRRAGKRSRLEQTSAAVNSISVGGAVGVAVTQEDAFFNIEADTSSQYAAYNCDVSPVPILQCSGSKWIQMFYMIIFFLNNFS